MPVADPPLVLLPLASCNDVDSGLDEVGRCKLDPGLKALGFIESIKRAALFEETWECTGSLPRRFY